MEFREGDLLIDQYGYGAVFAGYHPYTEIEGDCKVFYHSDANAANEYSTDYWFAEGRHLLSEITRQPYGLQ